MRFIRKQFTSSIAIATASFSLMISPAAYAQDDTAAENETGLSEIVVTAQRREENLQDVPLSITALSDEKLDAISAGGVDVRGLSGRVPSLLVESSFGRTFPRFYIRGLGNTDFDFNASQPVSLVYDDVVQENPVLKGFPIFDMERIEVLRGPQGTLFGRNSPAGVVRFESAKPGKKFEGYGTLSIGRYSAVNAEGAVNVPLSSTAALRVAVQSQNRDDWVKNTRTAGPTQDYEGFNDNAARVHLLLTPDKNYSVLFNVHTRDLKGSARVFRANIIQPGTNNLVAGFDETRVSQDGINSQDVKSTGGSVRVRWDMGNGMALSSITGYETVKSFSRGDIDGGSPPYVFGSPTTRPQFDAESGDGLPKHKQFTQELRLESTGSGALKWLAGLYYFDEELNIDSNNYSSLGGNARNGFATQQQDNRAYAVFGSVNLDVSDALKLRAGLRYTDDQKDFVADRFQAPPFSLTFIGRRTANTKATNTSGDFSASYALDKSTNVYGRVATGFRAPSIQGRLLFGDTLSVAKSEKVTSYEAGIKGDFFDRRARASASVFSFTVKDQQLTAVGGAANFNQLVNAAKSVGSGAEFDLQALVTDRLLVTLGGSFNKTQIKDPNLFVQPCGSGCTVLDPAGAKPGTVAINGNPLPNAPKTILNFSARYGMPVPGGEFYLLTDWAYRGEVNFFLYESTEFRGKALLEGGLRAGYNFGQGKYEAAAYVRNIANQIRVVGGIDFNNLTGFINEPRTFGVSFKANF